MMNDQVNIHRILSTWCIAFSAVTLIFTELGLSSLIGDWSPTHELSIALGVLGIGYRVIAIDLAKD